MSYVIPTCLWIRDELVAKGNATQGGDVAFKVTSAVPCSLQLVNKFEINSVEDVKVLCECGILGLVKVHEMLTVTLTRSKPDPCQLISFATKAK